MRRMSLSKAAKPCTFAAALHPDNAIKTPEVALANEKNVIHTPRILSDGAFSFSLPEPRAAYRFLSCSGQALSDLGLDPASGSDPEFRRVVSGEVYADANFQKLYPMPYAQAYAGWQFGQFAGQLGDGRALSLFDVESEAARAGNNRPKYEIQLKGSGKTPYSRFADGKAVLRSSIREYIISEHLHSVGIPSTRALAITYLPKTKAQRNAAEKCAIVARFAQSWVRIGTFDLYRWRFDGKGLRELCDYVISDLFTVEKQEFPHWAEISKLRPHLVPDSSTIGALTCWRQMYLEIACRPLAPSHFCVTTDNNLCAWRSTNASNVCPDRPARIHRVPSVIRQFIRLKNLPPVTGNPPVDDGLFRSGTIHPHWEERIVKRATKLIEAAGEIYKYTFTKQYMESFFARLGLSPTLIDYNNLDQHNTDLIAPMLAMLGHVQCDFNKFFVHLQDSDVGTASFNKEAFARSILLKEVSEFEHYDRDALVKEVCEWLDLYEAYLKKGGRDKKISSKRNPLFLPRNWILDEVISYTQESDGEDLSYLHKLEKMAFNPYEPAKWGDELKEMEKKWMLQSDMGTDYSMLRCSCSS
ncbi:hypothetical protein E0198_001299 [Clavispora lusitaniae]|nr:hypothetical protein E0198_001299 [Clavispora lusitaniae]